MKLLLKIINEYPGNTKKALTFEPNSFIPVQVVNRLAGRPYTAWTEPTLHNVWKSYGRFLDETGRYTTFDPTNDSHTTKLTELAYYWEDINLELPPEQMLKLR